MEGRPHRRVTAPVALLAALAIAAGGGSSPMALRHGRAAAASRPAVIHLAHIELVAMRAQASPAEPGAAGAGAFAAPVAAPFAGN